MFSVILVAIWSGIGYRMVVYLAALQGIPRAYYEAAAIERSRALGCVSKYITLPFAQAHQRSYILVTQA